MTGTAVDRPMHQNILNALEHALLVLSHLLVKYDSRSLSLYGFKADAVSLAQMHSRDAPELVAITETSRATWAEQAPV